MAENKQQKSQMGLGSRPGGPGGPGRGFMMGMPVVKPKDFKTTALRLWKYFGGERKTLILMFVFVLLTSASFLAAPFLSGLAIDVMTGAKGYTDFSLLIVVVIAMIAVYVLEMLLNTLQGWIMAGVSQRIVKSLRRALFAKLQKLPVAFFDSKTHGEVMSRLTNDIENVSMTISQSTTQLMSGSVILLGSLVMMLLLSPWLTLASLITVPLVFLLTGTITKKTGALFKQNQMELGKLNGHIEETISGIQTVKAFNYEEKAIEEFDTVNERLYQASVKAQIWSGYLMPLMNVINNIGFAAVAGVGGFLAASSAISVGVIASFIGYSRQFSRPLNELANIFNTLQSAIAGAERVFETMDEIEEPDDSQTAATLESPRGDVEFEDVCFSYRPDSPILKNVSFSVKAGQDIALVGPTGAGKTTVVNLLTRFYDVSSGHIRIDGKDIREYSRDSLRRCFGIVLQDTYLFSGTIRENIRYGNLSATECEIIAAAQTANADAFIRRLPKGYDTELTESGGSLSQGQRQLLAIARAVLSDPSILILDEATSSVDTLTEMHIQEAMLKLMKGRTCFIIAHRLSTIRGADNIMVIDAGHIVEQGNHQQLIDLKGEYYTMVYNQYKNLDETLSA